MPKLAANLTMMFQEDAFLKRFSSARSCGFKGVEFHFPYQWSKNDLADVLGENELEQVLFNLPSGNWEKGERGNAALPGREQEFRDGLGLALEYAQALGCKKIHAMAGVIQDEKKRGEMEEVFIENLRYGADICFKAGVQLLIEPLNTVDTPGYFLSTSKQAIKIIDSVGADNLFLQYDVYHHQIMEGDLSRSLVELMPNIGHIQIASIPGRHEPNEGEINYNWLLNNLDEIGYQGWVGLRVFSKGKNKGWARLGRIVGHNVDIRTLDF